MAKKKVYAVKKGYQTGLFYSWDECSKAVKRYPAAEYKSFVTEKEALDYLNNTQLQIITKDNGIIAYVDGSYDEEQKKYAYGCVIILPSGELKELSGYGTETDAAAIRNVAGEMLGAMHAVLYALNNGYESVEICYDYMGIEQWATGGWKANNQLTQKYAEAMKRWMSLVSISFKKVPAHSNVEYNERADRLAKAALKNNQKN